MGSSTSLTLAALATSAVADLDVRGSRELTGDGSGMFRSALLDTDRGDLMIRVPRSEAAEVQQSAELLGMAALTEGARSMLPFTVPESQGMTRAGDTRAVVTTFLEGDRFDVSDLASDALLLSSLASSIAAVHSLPVSIAHGAGLRLRSANDVRLRAVRVADRAKATGMLPETIYARWLEVLEESSLWDFPAMMVHGSLDADQFRVRDDAVVGVLGWSEFGTGDPADDLAWVLGADEEVFDAFLPRYLDAVETGSWERIRVRALLHHELQLAQWLLHGIDTHDEAIVDDAVSLLDRMVDRIGARASLIRRASSLSPTDVETLLEDIPRFDDSRSETAEYESLDEDRMFSVGDEETREERDEAPSHEQETQPIDPLEPDDPEDFPDRQ